MSRHMVERTTVRLPDELLRRAKQKAARDATTLTALIEEGLRRVVEDPPSDATRPRVMPRVSTATGGLAPGYDWERLAKQTEEEDDVVRLRRDW